MVDPFSAVVGIMVQGLVAIATTVLPTRHINRVLKTEAAEDVEAALLISTFKQLSLLSNEDLDEVCGGRGTNPRYLFPWNTIGGGFDFSRHSGSHNRRRLSVHEPRSPSSQRASNLNDASTQPRPRSPSPSRSTSLDSAPDEKPADSDIVRVLSRIRVSTEKSILLNHALTNLMSANTEIRRRILQGRVKVIKPTRVEEAARERRFGYLNLPEITQEQRFGEETLVWDAYSDEPDDWLWDGPAAVGDSVAVSE